MHSNALVKLPADICLWNGNRDAVWSVSSGPSKFAEFRRVNWRLTRSRVLGIMNVAFRNYRVLVNAPPPSRQDTGKGYLTLRLDIFRDFRIKGVEGPAGAACGLMLKSTLPVNSSWVLDAQ